MSDVDAWLQLAAVEIRRQWAMQLLRRDNLESLDTALDLMENKLDAWAQELSAYPELHFTVDALGTLGVYARNPPGPPFLVVSRTRARIERWHELEIPHVVSLAWLLLSQPRHPRWCDLQSIASIGFLPRDNTERFVLILEDYMAIALLPYLTAGGRARIEAIAAQLLDFYERSPHVQSTGTNGGLAAGA